MIELSKEIECLSHDLDQKILDIHDLTPTLHLQKTESLDQCNSVSTLTHFIELCFRLQKFIQSVSGSSSLLTIANYLISVARERRQQLIAGFLSLHEATSDLPFNCFAIFNQQELAFLGSPEFYHKEFCKKKDAGDLYKALVNDGIIQIPLKEGNLIELFNTILKETCLSRHKNSIGKKNEFGASFQNLIQSVESQQEGSFSSLSQSNQRERLYVNRTLLETCYSECPKTKFLSYLKALVDCDDANAVSPIPLYFMRVENSIGYVEPVYVWGKKRHSELGCVGRIHFHFKSNKAIDTVGENAKNAALRLFPEKKRDSLNSLNLHVSLKDFPGNFEDQTLESQSVGSLGLALSAAFYYNYRIVLTPKKQKEIFKKQLHAKLRSCVFSGVVSPLGEVKTVTGIAAKTSAAFVTGFSHIFIPLQDRKEIPKSAPSDHARKIKGVRTLRETLSTVERDLFRIPKLVSIFVVVFFSFSFVFILETNRYLLDFNLVLHKAMYNLRGDPETRAGSFRLDRNKKEERIILVLTNEMRNGKRKEKEADIEVRSKLVDLLTYFNNPRFRPALVGMDFFFQNRYDYENSYMDMDHKLAYRVKTMNFPVVIPMRVNKDRSTEIPYQELFQAVSQEQIGYTNIPVTNGIFNALAVDLKRLDRHGREYPFFGMTLVQNLFSGNMQTNELTYGRMSSHNSNINLPWKYYLADNVESIPAPNNRTLLMPLDESGQVSLNFKKPLLEGGSWDYNLLDNVLLSFQIHKSKDRTPAPVASLEKFKNAIVLIGGHFDPNKDRFKQPLGEIAGIEIFANFVNNALTQDHRHLGNFLIRVSKQKNRTFLALLCLLVTIIVIYFDKSLFVTTIVFLSVLFLVCLSLFVGKAILLDPVGYILAGLFPIILAQGYRYHKAFIHRSIMSPTALFQYSMK